MTAAMTRVDRIVAETIAARPLPTELDELDAESLADLTLRADAAGITAQALLNLASARTRQGDPVELAPLARPR